MPTPSTNPLAELRDIHLPEAISAWPPAPGWYLLALLVLSTLALIGFSVYRYWRKRRPQRLALRQLKQLEMQLTQTTCQTTILAELSILLRRTALAYFPRHHVASLHDQAWIDFLNKTSKKQSVFNQELARLLIRGPYQKEVEGKLEDLFAACRKWLKSVVKFGEI